MELSAIRVAGLVASAAVIGFAIWRRRSLRNVDVLILLFAGLALAIVSATELTNALLELFSFRKGGGGRILGLAVFAIFIMFLLLLRNMALTARVDRELSAVLEGIAWEEFRSAGLPERFKDKVAVVIPAYNEEDNIGAVLPRIPATVCGVETAVLVVDDGSRDRTGDIARAHGAAVARHVINRGGGAALRTGYRLMSDSGASRRRDARRRRPAPARGDVAPRAPRARRRGRRRARLARAGARGAEPLRARDGHRVLQPDGLVHHAHEGQRLLERLSRGALVGAAAARAAPGAVPHVRVHDRGDQARRAREGDPDHRRRSGCTGTRRSRQ